MSQVNLFDANFSHVSCSVPNGTLTKFEYVRNEMQWDRITIFTNEYIFSNLEKYKTSELTGSPMTHNFTIGNFFPITIRYIKVLCDLIEDFGSLDNYSIIEVDAGHGGQAKIICDTFNTERYCIVDLKETLDYQRDFLPADKQYDLFIRNYAFSECGRSTQNSQIEKGIKKSKNGYMTTNFISHHFRINSYPKHELLDTLPFIEEHKETPLTHPENCILKWKRLY